MKRVFFIIATYVIPGVLTAQSYYMHEAAEDSDGNPVSGILSLSLLIGIGIVIDKLWGNGKKQDDTKNELDSYYYDNDDTIYENEDEALDRYLYDSQFEDNAYMHSQMSLPQRDVDISQNFVEDKASYAFKVISLYGDNTERFGRLLVIKENGEYHYLLSSHQDDRYKILSDYISSKRTENCTDIGVKVDWELIRFYEMIHENEIPRFNPIEDICLEKNDFMGGKILALKSYYERLPCWRSHPVYRLEFFMSIGFDETVLLHKMIKKPMEGSDWHDMKVIQIKGFNTYEEFQRYQRKAGKFHEEDDGWYDGWYGFLASTYEEAGKVYEEKVGYTYMDAYNDVSQIKWKI